MSASGIHGQSLEVTVVECNKLKDTEWISRQDPYVCLEYGPSKFRTRTCTDGGKNPIFQEKFAFTLIEGLREISVVVWNSNTLTYDDFIGSGRVSLEDVLCRGYDDRSWSLQTKTGRHAGKVKLIMRYANANANPFGGRSKTSVSPSAPPYPPSPQSQTPAYSTPPVASITQTNPTRTYPSSPCTAYPPPPTPYRPPSTAYPPTSPCLYSHNTNPTTTPYLYPYNDTNNTSSPYNDTPYHYPTSTNPATSPYPNPNPNPNLNPQAYPPNPYPPPPDRFAYPPPTSVYPPPPSVYPPPPHVSPYPPPGHYPRGGGYPPPPY